MPGLMARILNRRSDGAPPPAPEVSADAPTVVVPAVEPAPEGQEAAASGEEAVLVEEAVPEPGTPAEPATVQAEAVAEPAADIPAPAVPAGAEEAPVASPTFLTRGGRLRRRLRYLRRVREIGFRDLGGWVFDLDRFGRERPDLVELKLAGLQSIDAELRALEIALEDLPAAEELSEPGISACARCGALHGSEARFCPSCGTGRRRPAGRGRAGRRAAVGRPGDRSGARPAPRVTERAPVPCPRCGATVARRPVLVRRVRARRAHPPGPDPELARAPVRRRRDRPRRRSSRSSSRSSS